MAMYFLWQQFNMLVKGTNWNESNNFGDSDMTFGSVGSELFPNGGNADGFSEPMMWKRLTVMMMMLTGQKHKLEIYSPTTLI